jgi:hypothetical protein
MSATCVRQKRYMATRVAVKPPERRTSLSDTGALQLRAAFKHCASLLNFLSCCRGAGGNETGHFNCYMSAQSLDTVQAIAGVVDISTVRPASDTIGEAFACMSPPSPCSDPSIREG